MRTEMTRYRDERDTRLVVPGILLMGLSALLAIGVVPVQAADKLDRTVLPIPEPKRPAITEIDVRKATAPPRFEVKAPAGAPNVLIVLIDDMGFGISSAFGGPIHMPTVERLADNGLRYNHFHTTALCSPTRAALLSGRNHHMNNMGAITEILHRVPRQYREPTEQCRAAGRDVAAERL